MPDKADHVKLVERIAGGDADALGELYDRDPPDDLRTRIVLGLRDARTPSARSWGDPRDR